MLIKDEEVNRMKKTKLLSLALVIAIALMGAGYAYWTDTLTINNTVSTGELNVEFIEQDFSIWPPQLKFPDTLITDGTETNYATATIVQNSPKKTTVKVNNMYPGVWALYDAKFQNTGTIPAVIENVTINPIQTSESLNENLVVFGGYVHWKPGFIPTSIDEDIFICTLGNFQTTINDLLKDIRLEKGEYITFDIPEDKREELNELITPYGISLIDGENCINFILPPTVENEDGAELQTVEFDMELHFSQHNAQ